MVGGINVDTDAITSSFSGGSDGGGSSGGGGGSIDAGGGGIATSVTQDVEEQQGGGSSGGGGTSDGGSTGGGGIATSVTQDIENLQDGDGSSGGGSTGGGGTDGGGIATSVTQDIENLQDGDESSGGGSTGGGGSDGGGGPTVDPGFTGTGGGRGGPSSAEATAAGAAGRRERTRAQQGVETESGQEGARARTLEREFIAQNPGATRDDVSVRRESGRLVPGYTPAGEDRRRRRRRTLDRYARDFGLEDEGLAGVEASEDRLVGSLEAEADRQAGAATPGDVNVEAIERSVLANRVRGAAGGGGRAGDVSSADAAQAGRNVLADRVREATPGEGEEPTGLDVTEVRGGVEAGDVTVDAGEWAPPVEGGPKPARGPGIEEGDPDEGPQYVIEDPRPNRDEFRGTRQEIASLLESQVLERHSQLSEEDIAIRPLEDDRLGVRFTMAGVRRQWAVGQAARDVGEARQSDAVTTARVDRLGAIDAAVESAIEGQRNLANLEVSGERAGDVRVAGLPPRIEDVEVGDARRAGDVTVEVGRGSPLDVDRFRRGTQVGGFGGGQVTVEGAGRVERGGADVELRRGVDYTVEPVFGEPGVLRAGLTDRRIRREGAYQFEREFERAGRPVDLEPDEDIQVEDGTATLTERGRERVATSDAGPLQSDIDLDTVRVVGAGRFGSAVVNRREGDIPLPIGLPGTDVRVPLGEDAETLAYRAGRAIEREVVEPAAEAVGNIERAPVPVTPTGQFVSVPVPDAASTFLASEVRGAGALLNPGQSAKTTIDALEYGKAGVEAAGGRPLRTTDIEREMRVGPGPARTRTTRRTAAAPELERFGEASGEAVVEGVEATVDYARANPVEFAGAATGALAASGIVMGGAGALGRGPGLVSRLAIQPGEEALGYGLNRGFRAAGSVKWAERIAPNNEPVFFSEEAAIRGTRLAARKVAGTPGRVRRIASGREAPFMLARRGEAEMFRPGGGTGRVEPEPADTDFGHPDRTAEPIGPVGAEAEQVGAVAPTSEPLGSGGRGSLWTVESAIEYERRRLAGELEDDQPGRSPADALEDEATDGGPRISPAMERMAGEATGRQQLERAADRLGVDLEDVEAGEFTPGYLAATGSSRPLEFEDVAGEARERAERAGRSEVLGGGFSERARFEHVERTKAARRQSVGDYEYEGTRDPLDELERRRAEAARLSFETEAEFGRVEVRARTRETTLLGQRQREGVTERVAETEVELPRQDFDLETRQEHFLDLELEQEAELEQEQEQRISLEAELEREQEVETETEFETEREIELEGGPREPDRRKRDRRRESFDVDVEYLKAPIASAGQLSRGLESGADLDSLDSGFDLGPSGQYETGPQRLNGADRSSRSRDAPVSQRVDVPAPSRSGRSSPRRSASSPPSYDRSLPTIEDSQPRQSRGGSPPRRSGGLGDLDVAVRGTDNGAVGDLGGLDPMAGGGLD